MSAKVCPKPSADYRWTVESVDLGVGIICVGHVVVTYGRLNNCQ